MRARSSSARAGFCRRQRPSAGEPSRRPRCRSTVSVEGGVVMARRLALCLVLGALAAAPAALAGYPSPAAQQGGPGVLSRDGSTRFVALAAHGDTVVAKIRTADGSVRSSRSVSGSFGIPILVYGREGEGTAHVDCLFLSHCPRSHS